jgi:hypothetical protein
MPPAPPPPTTFIATVVCNVQVIMP